MADPQAPFMPWFKVTFEEEEDTWAVTVGRQRFLLKDRTSVRETGMLTVVSPRTEPVYGPVSTEEDFFEFQTGPAVIGYRPIEAEVSACFRGHIGNTISGLVGLPNGHAAGTFIARKVKRRRLAMAITKVLPTFDVEPRIRVIHRWLFSVRGQPPATSMVRNALELPYPEDLRFLACRSLLVRAEVSHRGARHTTYDWTTRMLGKPLHGLARRLPYHWPGGLPIDTLIQVVALAEANYLHGVPPTRTHWFALARVREQHDRLKRAVGIIMHSGERELLNALCAEQSKSLPRSFATLGNMSETAEDLWHYGEVVSLAGQVRARAEHCEEGAPWWARYWAAPGLRFPQLLRESPVGWEYLDSSERFNEESRQMRHCVASYAEDASAGRTYIFHRTGPPSLTIQIVGDRIVQAHGKANSSPLEAMAAAESEWNAWVRQGPWH